MGRRKVKLERRQYLALSLMGLAQAWQGNGAESDVSLESRRLLLYPPHMRRMLIPVAALLLSDALLLIGHGLQLTLIPISAELLGFSAGQIGMMGSTYYLGFVSGCLLTPLLVRRVGHIRSFAILATGYSALVLLFYSLQYISIWLLLRFAAGLAIAGLYMTIESWLSERSTSETRGTILSIYVVINMSMTMVGQQLLNVADPLGQTLFIVISVLLSLALIPVCLTTALAPAPIHNVSIDLRKVWNLSQVGVAGAIATGLVTGAFWSLGPLYARELGFDTQALTIFLSAVVLGGAVFQLPLGRLSDHYDRRLVLFYTTLLGIVLSALLVYLPDLNSRNLTILAFFWGACVMTQYAVSLAHANDRADPEDFVMVGSVMLLSMGVFSAIGSVLAAFFMQWFGPRGLFIFSLACLSGFALAIAARRRVHVLPVHDETEAFRAVAAATTPMALELDPRNEELPEEDEGGLAAEEGAPEEGGDLPEGGEVSAQSGGASPADGADSSEDGPIAGDDLPIAGGDVPEDERGAPERGQDLLLEGGGDPPLRGEGSPEEGVSEGEESVAEGEEGAPKGEAEKRAADEDDIEAPPY